MRYAIKIGLFWGVTMFVGMTLTWPLIDGNQITLRTALFGLLIWIPAGLLFGSCFRKKNK